MSKPIPCPCGATCPYEGENPGKPCWGQVRVVDWQDTDDGELLFHACEGHWEIAQFGGEGGKYCVEGV